MSTPLTGGLLGHFSYIFTIILGFLIMYALLKSTKILGENDGINAIVSLLIALLLLLSPKIVTVFTIMAPWFIGLVMFGLLMFLFMGIFGASNEDIVGAFKKHVWIPIVLVVVSIIILLASLSEVYGDVTDFPKTSLFLQVLFNPLVLGTVVILIIGALAIRLLTQAKS